MAPKVKASQEDYLYGVEWGEKMDMMFAEVLADQALMGTFHCNNIDNKLAVDTTQYMVNKYFNTTLSIKTCWRQISKLRTRHKVFSWLLSLDGVRYDKSTNRMHVNPTIWKSIIKVEEFANAYEKYGDPCWDWLKTLFGVPPVVPPQPVPISIHADVVLIPSEDDPLLMDVHEAANESDSEETPSIRTVCRSSNSNSVYGTPTKPDAPSRSGWSTWRK